VIRARIVKLASAREGAVAVPLPESGCAHLVRRVADADEETKPRVATS
jgi:hypothetical protein